MSSHDSCIYPSQKFVEDINQDHLGQKKRMLSPERDIIANDIYLLILKSYTCVGDFTVCGFKVTGLVGVSSMPGKRSYMRS